jgi:hypothetical protein
VRRVCPWHPDGVLALPEIADVEVDVAAGRVRVSGDALDGDRVGRQLSWLGFPPASEEDDDADR